MIAIVGAGELGGAVAQAIASRDCAGRVLLIDANAAAAAGKALDIRQMGAVDGFHTRVDGAGDLDHAVGCAVCVVADRFGGPAAAGPEDEGPSFLTRLVCATGDAPIVFAGANHDGLILAAARDAGASRARLIGSAAEAYRSAVVAMVALEARTSPDDVALAVVGAPHGLVVPLSEATIGGYALDRVLSQAQIAAVEARAARLWPPAAYALGAAAARVVASLVHDDRRTHHVFTVLDGELGVRRRVGALPASLGARGILALRVPPLDARDRVRLETTLGTA